MWVSEEDWKFCPGIVWFKLPSLLEFPMRDKPYLGKGYFMAGFPHLSLDWHSLNSKSFFFRITYIFSTIILDTKRTISIKEEDFAGRLRVSYLVESWLTDWLLCFGFCACTKWMKEILQLTGLKESQLILCW